MMNRLLSLLFPPKCAACGRMLNFRGLDRLAPTLCSSCQKQWDSEKLDVCEVCGKPVSLCHCMPEELIKAHCTVFRKDVYYRHGTGKCVQNRLIYKIKNAASQGTVEFFASELAELAADINREYHLKQNTVLVYVPRGKKAVLQKGTDQAERLAYALSDLTSIPVLPAIKRRPGKQKPQKKLDFRERRRNAKESYCLTRHSEVTGADVIVVDDIVTTGCSMAAVARLLYPKGAARVFCLAVSADDSHKTMKLP